MPLNSLRGTMVPNQYKTVTARGGDEPRSEKRHSSFFQRQLNRLQGEKEQAEWQTIDKKNDHKRHSGGKASIASFLSGTIKFYRPS
ncbi:hypothetical protein M514_03710 [Trichuris suis]|uniref:Uncharacterized protein n=1 Tax=Trichuris suis TaxID=68888 RepID=A0A085NGU7_9BILA|nr:hypothetical protein M513_03710 [Trichuris suis]KFD68693.1 hypothetical protein M514_03710 [Trichuris suis]